MNSWTLSTLVYIVSTINKNFSTTNLIYDYSYKVVKDVARVELPNVLVPLIV